MNRAVLVDDDESFVLEVERTVSRKGIQDMIYITSYEEAEKVIKQEKSICIHIIDLVLEFEDSPNNGLRLLEVARSINPNSECILLTGYRLTKTQRNHLDRINGKLLYKWDLSEELLCDLLSGQNKFKGKKITSRQEIDIGEMKLRYEKMNETLNEMIKDVYQELQSIENQNEPGFVIGNKQLSLAELIRHVKDKDDIGMEVIKMYQALIRRLKGGYQ